MRRIDKKTAPTMVMPEVRVKKSASTSEECLAVPATAKALNKRPSMNSITAMMM